MGQKATVTGVGTIRSIRTYPVLAGLVLAAAAGATVLASPAQAAPATGQIYVIQGISGQNLDVQVDGKVVLAKAESKAIVGPLKLDPGTHEVVVGSGSSAVSSDVSIEAGESVDVVAHPATSAQAPPAITAFKNDVASVGPGKVRLAVAHTAAAPPADIKVNGDVLFSNVANAEALTVVVPADTYKVEVVPSATSGDPILGPVDLAIKAGTLTRVFAIGDVTKGTMDAVVHVVPVAVKGSGAPSSVQTGDGGQAAAEFTSARPAWTGWALAGLTAILLLGLGASRSRSWAAAASSSR